MTPDIKRDTAAFGPRQWFIEGHPQMFTTEDDARLALDLALAYAKQQLRDVVEKIEQQM